MNGGGLSGEGMWLGVTGGCPFACLGALTCFRRSGFSPTLSRDALSGRGDIEWRWLMDAVCAHCSVIFRLPGSAEILALSGIW